MTEDEINKIIKKRLDEEVREFLLYVKQKYMAVHIIIMLAQAVILVQFWLLWVEK